MGLDSLSFQGKWRSYQQRVLDELEGHLDDGHLHVVAAPGSGKTILGLEVMRRFGDNALILAPTITIRNQWAARLSMFLPDGAPAPGWVSRDIRKPGPVTVITYQALHAAFSRAEDAADDELPEAEEEDDSDTDRDARIQKKLEKQVIDALKAHGVGTLVLDEAHHLRNEWWKALIALKKGLKGVRTVSLTATPPYDVDPTEWERYEALCGPIDAEISVPELVRNGDLCPHQDYIRFSWPTALEREKIEKFHEDTREFIRGLADSDEFLDAVIEHPFLTDTEMHIEDILSEPDFFSAMLIYLNRAGVLPPQRCLDILGVKYTEMPGFDRKWMERLITSFLFDRAEDFAAHEKLQNDIRRHLKRIGAIERRKVRFTNTKEIKKTLSSSVSKLDSIRDVTEMESTAMGDALRMVILCDYIRKDDMPRSPNDLRPLARIGVIPVFEQLRRADIADIKLGVLTGSCILIPAGVEQALRDIVAERELAADDFTLKPAPFSGDFMELRPKGAMRQRIVSIITELFNRGGITVLVGTQALLGEGWDAPTVNTLVLASYVGSYMLSNQMRGRAIRIDPDRPDKAANIWHLVAIAPPTMLERMQAAREGKELPSSKRGFDPFDPVPDELGPDIETMKRRAKAFEGVSYKTPLTIENGLARFGFDAVEKWTQYSVADLNRDTIDRARARDELKRLWHAALETGNTRPMMEERLRSDHAPQFFVFINTLQYMLYQALFAGTAWLSQGGMDFDLQSGNVYLMIVVFCLTAMLVMLPRTLKALWVLLRNGTLEGNMKQVGNCVLDALCHIDAIQTGRNRLRVHARKNRFGVIICSLEGAATYERAIFLEALEELLKPVDNPRYILVRSSRIWLRRRTDFLAVPALIGQKKEYVQYFAKRWNRRVGDARFMYTRSVEGRRMLLKARMKAMSSAFRKKADIISKWE